MELDGGVVVPFEGVLLDFTLDVWAAAEEEDSDGKVSVPESSGGESEAGLGGKTVAGGEGHIGVCRELRADVEVGDFFGGEDRDGHESILVVGFEGSKM